MNSRSGPGSSSEVGAETDDESGVLSGQQSTRVLADHITVSSSSATEPPSNDGGLRWISPLGLAYSVDRLKTIPERHQVRGETLRIADIGAGAGQLTEALARWYRSREFVDREQTVEIVPNDLSPAAVEAIAERTSHFETVRDPVQGDARTAMVDVAPFDVVYAVNMVQDTDHPIEMVKAIAEMTREGGVAVATVPGNEATETFPDHVAVETFEEFGPDGAPFELPYMSMVNELDGEKLKWKQYAFPREATMTLFETAGFEVVDIDRIPADASGLPAIMEHVEAGDELVQRARQAADRQAEDVKAGPDVDRYVLRRTRTSSSN